MALGRTTTTALDGITARLVTVEANVGPGLPGISVVGLGDASVREARYRLRTAVANTALDWPKSKIVLSLSPADLPKRGSHFDLAMCLAVLAARHPGADARLRDVVVLGELGLDGSVRAVTGVLPSVLAAARENKATVLVPPGNQEEAALAEGIDVLVAPSLEAAWAWACGSPVLHRARPGIPGTSAGVPDFADLAGQHDARWATEVAAAGGHHMFLTGPPGSGKSMLAERLPGILPPLSRAEALEVGAIRSVAGVSADSAMLTVPPLSAPHHTVTRAGLLGGGSGHPSPGAVTHAHHGVLFLDEVSEIPAATLDCLRTPLEHRRIVLQRGNRSTVFPSRFQLLLAANPCRCAAENPGDCTCTVAERRHYLSNLSGPLLDRIDMIVRTTGKGAVVSTEGAEASTVIAARVAEARDRAARRWGNASRNSDVAGPYLRRHAPADETGMALIEAHLAVGDITQRGVDRALRLAWTICDLAGRDRPDLDHVARALELRGSQLEVRAA